MISPSGAAASANSEGIVLTQRRRFVQSNFTLIILTRAGFSAVICRVCLTVRN